jgi:hypothetical protein
MCTALTKAPFPPASGPRLDLETFQRRPGKGARVPVRLVQAHPWSGRWERHQGQLGPSQANRRGGQPGAKLGGRARLRRRPAGRGHVALGDAQRRRHQGRGGALQGHAVRAARGKTLPMHYVLPLEQQPVARPPPGIDVQRVGARPPAGLPAMRQPLADLAPLAPPHPPQARRGHLPCALALPEGVVRGAPRHSRRREVPAPPPALTAVPSTPPRPSVGGQSRTARPAAGQALAPPRVP